MSMKLIRYHLKNIYNDTTTKNQTKYDELYVR